MKININNSCLEDRFYLFFLCSAKPVEQKRRTFSDFTQMVLEEGLGSNFYNKTMYNYFRKLQFIIFSIYLAEIINFILQYVWISKDASFIALSSASQADEAEDDASRDD